MPPSELELSLRAVGTAADLPGELPVAHLTTAKWLRSILDAGKLIPRSCRVFHRDLIYFSYGGVFYRTSKMQSENAAELPVAMVFSPEVLDVCTRLFPFDSGAMAVDQYVNHPGPANRRQCDAERSQTLGQFAQPLVGRLSLLIQPTKYHYL